MHHAMRKLFVYFSLQYRYYIQYYSIYRLVNEVKNFKTAIVSPHDLTSPPTSSCETPALPWRTREHTLKLAATQSQGSGVTALKCSFKLRS